MARETGHSNVDRVYNQRDRTTASGVLIGTIQPKHLVIPVDRRRKTLPIVLIVFS